MGVLSRRFVVTAPEFRLQGLNSSVFGANAGLGTASFFSPSGVVTGATFSSLGTSALNFNTALVGVPINVGDTWATVVAANPINTTFVIKSGIHRLQSVTPKAGQKFIGEIGAVMSGAKVITASGSFSNPWRFLGQTQGSGPAAEDSALCHYIPESGTITYVNPCADPEDLFLDSVCLERVHNLGEGGPGKWFFDYANDIVYCWDNPNGHVAEISDTRQAFIFGSGGSVVIGNLVIEKYANSGTQATVNLGDDWLMNRCEVRYNHYAGVYTGDRAILQNSYLHRNGCFGIIGSGADVIVQDNEVAYNNNYPVQIYNSYNGAGGSKWVFAERLIVQRNFSHHNGGPGFWTDINNYDITYRNNTLEDNYRAGLFHEISYLCKIHDNTCRRNGRISVYAPFDSVDGQISVTNSSDVEVYNNVVEDNGAEAAIAANQDGRRGPGTHGAWELTNLYVHHNTTTALNATAETGKTGMVGDDAMYNTHNNKWDYNQYTLGSNAHYFWVSNGAGGANLANLSQWHSAGYDTHSYASDPAFP